MLPEEGVSDMLASQVLPLVDSCTELEGGVTLMLPVR